MTSPHPRSTDGADAEAVGTPCVDGAPLSAVDVARNLASAAAARDRLRCAVYAIAAHADSVDECRELLAMLGIDLDAVRAIRTNTDNRVA